MKDDGPDRLAMTALAGPFSAANPAPAPRSAPETDAAIIERSGGHPEWFATIFERHHAQILTYVARRLGQSVADDVTSETFLAAFERRDRYDTAYPDATPWLYGIATNLIARHHRAEQRRRRTRAWCGDEPSPCHAEMVAVRVDALGQRRSLAAALSGLSGGDRDVLLLVAWAQLTSEQVGRVLGIPAGTARSRLHRARRQARAALTSSPGVQGCAPWKQPPRPRPAPQPPPIIHRR